MKEKLYELPTNWKWVKLGEVVTLINGRAYKKNELLDSGDVPVLRVGNFFSNRSWYYSDLMLPEDKYCIKGDLLFAWSASFGPKIWDGPKAIYHYHIWKVLLSRSIDKYYLYHLLVAISSEIKAKGNGITMIHATKGGMEKRKIPLPPLPEQQKIAAILDAAEKLRQKDQQLIEQYNALSQSLFLDMFGDPVTNPVGWDKNKLGDLTNLVTDGKHGDCQDEENSGYFFISAKNIRDGFIDYSDTRQITQVDFSEVHRRTNLAIDDLVMVNTGATIGKIAIAKDVEKTGQTTFQKSVAVIKPKKDRLSTVFLKYVFLLRINDFASKGSGSAIKNLLLSEMKRFQIITPQLKLQNQFAERIQAIEAQKQQAQASLKKSDDLFNSLLQRAFKGELTEFPGDEAPASSRL